MAVPDAEHQSSVLLLYDEVGRILLQHRTEDAPMFPNHWGFFGGGIEQGETREEALRREIIEELAYVVNSPALLITCRYTYQDRSHTMYVYTERYSGSPLTLKEGQGMQWFLTSETYALLMNDHDRSVVGAFSRRLR